MSVPTPSNVINLDDYRRQPHAPVKPSPRPGPVLPWRESRRRNLYVNTERFNCVVYRLRGLWTYRITERRTNEGAYSRHSFPTQVAAQLAAEQDLGTFEREPRAWG